MQAFSERLHGSTATPEQIEFAELIVDDLTQNGVVVPETCSSPRSRTSMQKSRWR
jgi:hypothetical protein